MTEQKASYQTIKTISLLKAGFSPGDMITFTLRNEQEGIFQIAERLKLTFLASIGFFPESIAVHPDHLAILKKQGKTLDVLLPEEAVTAIGDEMDLQSLPRCIPLKADETLDLFTAAAQTTFEKEGSAHRMLEAVTFALRQKGKEEQR